MRLLVYEWSSYLQYDLYEILREYGISFQKIEWTFENKNVDEEFCEWFDKNIAKGTYDALISVNYWPLLSQACKKKDLKYVAWCYDCPLNVVNIEETLANTNNFVYFFDRNQYKQYRNSGFETVYHLPLGVNASRLKNLVYPQEEKANYQCDVSFVGSLYESLFRIIAEPLDDYTRGYLDSLIDMQMKVYGYYFLEELIESKWTDSILGQYQNIRTKLPFVVSKEALLFAMASEITRKERLILLQLCGSRFDTRLYSYQDSEILQNVKKCPPVDYIYDLPKVYAMSKINLNPTLKCIQTGIPLRVFDILGAGGFLLSNYQEELLEHFENERELVYYESLEDAIAKAEFYIRNESIRQRIMNTGRKKVLDNYTLQKRFDEIVRTSGL